MTNQLRAKIEEKLLLSSSINWRGTHKKNKKVRGAKREQVHTHNKDIKRRKKERHEQREQHQAKEEYAT